MVSDYVSNQQMELLDSLQVDLYRKGPTHSNPRDPSISEKKMGKIVVS